jgi:hypothetical protein
VQFVVLILCWIATLIPVFVTCRPLAYTWDRTIPGGKCFDVKQVWFWGSIIGLFFDLTCLVLPIPVFWGLNMSARKRIKLIVIFGLGFL